MTLSKLVTLTNVVLGGCIAVVVWQIVWDMPLVRLLASKEWIIYCVI